MGYAGYAASQCKKPKPPVVVYSRSSVRAITVSVIATIIICLPVGFFAGREHVKYELRQGFQGAWMNVVKALDSVPRRD